LPHLTDSATDKIGELADLFETQPGNTNDLQQRKSSPANFSPVTPPLCNPRRQEGANTIGPAREPTTIIGVRRR